MSFITSVTKLCTASVALLLHERTQPHLDEPIRTYVPFVIPEPSRLKASRCDCIHC